MKKIIKLVVSLFLFASIYSCYTDDSLDQKVDPVTEQESTDTLDVFLREKFTEPFDIFVRYEWDAKNVDLNRYSSPPYKESVKPAMNFVYDVWLKPFIEANDEEGREFLKQTLPPEVILIGSPIYQDDGTRLLGTADSGVRITLVEVDNFRNGGATTNQKFTMARTIHHEYTHIVNQRKQIPNNFRDVTPTGHTGNGWTGISFQEAVNMGRVTPYATKNIREDFAETVSQLITLPENEFQAAYGNNSQIMEKREIVINYYNSFGIDILAVRDALLQEI